MYFNRIEHVLFIAFAWSMTSTIVTWVDIRFLMKGLNPSDSHTRKTPDSNPIANYRSKHGHVRQAEGAGVGIFQCKSQQQYCRRVVCSVELERVSWTGGCAEM